MLAEDVAREYQRTQKWHHFESAEDLVAGINRFLASKGLAKSTVSRYEIANAVVQLHFAEREPVQHPLPTPAETAWAQNQMEGYGDPNDLALRQMDDLSLAGQVQAMSLDDWRKARSNFGFGKGTFEHLAGH